MIINFDLSKDFFKNENNRNEVSKRLKKFVTHILSEENLTQKELAEKSGIIESRFSSAVNGGVRYLNKSFIEDFLKYFSEIDPNWLIYGNGNDPTIKCVELSHNNLSLESQSTPSNTEKDKIKLDIITESDIKSYLSSLIRSKEIDSKSINDMIAVMNKMADACNNSVDSIKKIVNTCTDSVDSTKKMVNALLEKGIADDKDENRRTKKGA